MEYRKLINLDWEASALGFGAMRFPTTEDGKIDEEESIEMIRYAVDHGINYVDTAWPYHGGESELLVAKALKDGYREKVKLATKLPSWLIEKREDMDYYLNKQLEKLETDYIDFYLLHALNRERWDKFKELDVFSWIEKILAEGKIKHIGFSFHDGYELFEEIIDGYDWDFCQIQYNYLDVDFQAGKRGLKYAHDNGVAVIIMEPLKGGQLALAPADSVKEIFDNAPIKRSYVDWALQWLWDQEEVAFILSGMSNLQQVKENIESAANSGVNTLTKEELIVIEQLQNKYQELSPVSCTGCEYCIPCPVGVNIPANFKLYNRAKIYNKFEENNKKYNEMGDKEKANTCVECGACEKVCPQNLEIIELLKDVNSYFE
ncbi:aldo/keto reductase [Orenia metallireducens]|uniref:Aldo/keto reductase n=1 Tax=Orenia metallireducens TaxID=1413210 RepID=A0A1C0A9U8_9FIRM|nr:aldo/keto reductase [Orenia metallireducens]OCL27062.1 aldo/keto reductase [Orenia metallireducens]